MVSRKTFDCPRTCGHSALARKGWIHFCNPSCRSFAAKSARVTLPVRHAPSSAELFRVGVLAFPFVAGSLDAAGGDADPVLPEEPHAPRTVQVTASTATPLSWLPRRVFRLPLAFMVAPLAQAGLSFGSPHNASLRSPMPGNIRAGRII